MVYSFTMINIRLFLILLFLTPLLSHAGSITLPSDQEVNVEVYGEDDAKHQILWMHSEYGISAELQHVILNTTKKEDVQVFLPDWLDSYYIHRSRSSLEKIPQDDFEDLIRHYTEKMQTESKKLIIIAESRAASLALNAAHHLQSEGNDLIAGIILISPYLQKQTPKIGTAIEYQKITSHSNLPLYLMQAERSPRFVPLNQLTKELEKGGSAVYTQIFKGITGGFHARSPEDLTEKDLKAKETLPQKINNAIMLLKSTEAAPLKALDKYKKNIRITSSQKLQLVDHKTPNFSLNDIQGKTHNIGDYKDKAVLVSFWASWCRPCIEEMPSLVKLKQKYKDKLEILAVNVREDKEMILKFTKTMNINFPLLQDLDSSTTADWKVYVYPSNFILDGDGNLRYAAIGSMNWQKETIEKKIESLWAESKLQ